MVALVVMSFAGVSMAARRVPALLKSHVGDEISYHGGAVLRGDIPVTVVWYGKFKPAQKAIVVDFLLSLTATTPPPPNATTPSAAQWWSTIAAGYLSSNATAGGGGGGANLTTTRVVLANQTSDEEYSLGKSLTLVEVFQLAAGVVPDRGDLVVVLTDPDVVVEGFCSARCGVHGSDAGAGYAYAWAGNAERQCPGQCAWPFAKPPYGPKDEPALVPPNGDVGADGMVATLAGVVAGAVTNPFGDGYYVGDKDAALEACSACAGAYGSDSYPGYAGKVLVDETTGGSYNAVGAHGRKYLLPAVYDPATSRCTTLV
uniref:Phi-1 n=1 Tax=Oryza punctata TaxID=4537 RepID=A0A0E0L9F3_ORYPU